MATMTTTINLTPEQSSQLHHLISTGRYTSADEAVQHLVSQVLDDELVASYSPKVLAHLQRGFDETVRGELVSQEEVETLFQEWRSDGSSRTMATEPLPSGVWSFSNGR